MVNAELTVETRSARLGAPGFRIKVPTKEVASPTKTRDAFESSGRTQGARVQTFKTRESMYHIWSVQCCMECRELNETQRDGYLLITRHRVAAGLEGPAVLTSNTQSREPASLQSTNANPSARETFPKYSLFLITIVRIHQLRTVTHAEDAFTEPQSVPQVEFGFSMSTSNPSA